MTTTHMLLPVAATIAAGGRPVRWKLVIAACVAAGAPDIDGLFKHFFHIPEGSIYSHRGFLHSLFVALAAGLLAAMLHRPLEVRPLVAGVVIAGAMASHGILDMMTDSGQPVAYLWPLSSARLFADWRPIHSGSVHMPHISTLTLSHFGSELRPSIAELLVRFRSEFWQLIMPITGLAVVTRILRMVITGKQARR